MCPKREQIASVITGKNKLRAWSDRTDELGCTPVVCKSVSNKEHVLDYCIKLIWIINWEVSGWIVHKNYSFNVIISPKTCLLRYLPFSPKTSFATHSRVTTWLKVVDFLNMAYSTGVCWPTNGHTVGLYKQTNQLPFLGAGPSEKYRGDIMLSEEMMNHKNN